jgi:hypothetical protein
MRERSDKSRKLKPINKTFNLLMSQKGNDYGNGASKVRSLNSSFSAYQYSLQDHESLMKRSFAISIKEKIPT